jgi:predicted MFS family arabinose efflux permease
VSEPSEPSASERATKRRERNVLLLLATIQFINILDFMMVMPLGPDFARDLGISTSHLGVIGGSYTAAAAVSGLVGALVLDRFDRKRALAVAMLGLAVGTAAGGFADWASARWCSRASWPARSAARPRASRSRSSPTSSRPSAEAAPWRS